MNRWNSSATAAAAAVAIFSLTATAGELPPELRAEGVDEEVVVLGRLYSSSQALIEERKQREVVIDVMHDETLARLGDSTVAAALRRVSGLALIDEKFVYVRGLGERYSSTSLNGARVPSPDLTRNVIPLDIFPTSIVRSLVVQKGYSADSSANFGGGAVDIRTKAVPSTFTFGLEVGSGLNLATGDEILTYRGGGNDRWGTDDGTRALPGFISSRIDRYRANVNVQQLLNELRREGNHDATVADAQEINRSLATALNRDISIGTDDSSPDLDVKGSIGTSFDIGNRLEFGIHSEYSYDTNWRHTERTSYNFQAPEERTDTKRETTRSMDVTAILNAGLNFTDDHEVAGMALMLRNTDDKAGIRDFFDENRERSDGLGNREYRLKFEQRELMVKQLHGSHRIGGETREMIPGAWLDWMPELAELTWFYSMSTATTDIPNQVSVDAQTQTDPDTGDVLQSRVKTSSSAARFRFTDLDDEILNYGWKAMFPIEINWSLIELSGGYQHEQKARTYAQSQFGVGPLSVSDPATLRGDLSDVFSEGNILDPDNDYVFSLLGSGTRSYMAATMTDAVFGKLDWTWNGTFRFSAGARWEDYRQVALPWNRYGYSVDNPQISTDPEVLEEATFLDDRIYPAVSAMYIGSWLAEVFQLRLGYGKTTVLPDLREITDASYVDPITDEIVNGNPGVVPSLIDNFDLRAEWFPANGDNYTVSLFLKRIANPIEYFESPASDTNVAREILNADSAEVKGIEFEIVKQLGFLGDWGEAFFLQSNVTVQDSGIEVGPDANAPTNPRRPLTGASNYVFNMMLGYDSFNSKHSASLIYNVFGERLYVAGRLGAPDGYEQPFHSLDFTYSWFPTETLTVKAKFKNILDQTIEIQRESIVTFEEDPGPAFAVSLKWEY